MKSNYLILFLGFAHPVLSLVSIDLTEYKNKLIKNLGEIELVKDILNKRKRELTILYIESNRYKHYFDIDEDVTYNDTLAESDESVDPELLEHINNIKQEINELSIILDKAVMNKNVTKLYFKRELLKCIQIGLFLGLLIWFTGSVFILTIYKIPEVLCGSSTCGSYASKVLVGIFMAMFVNILGRFIVFYHSLKNRL